MRPTVQLIAVCATLSASAIGVMLVRRTRTRARKQSFGHDERIANDLGAILLTSRAHLADSVSEAQRREALTAIEATASDAVAVIRRKIAREAR